jgi:hypothetical protein
VTAAKRAVSVVLVVTGLIMIVVTAAAGAGIAPAVGYFFGAGLTAAGGLRLYLLRKGPQRG